MALAPKIAPTKPDLAGWLFAVLSILATLIASVALIVAARENRAAMASEGLSKSIDDLDFGGARRYLKVLIGREPLERLVAFLAPSPDDDWSAKKGAADALIEVISLLTAGKPEEALRLFESSASQWLSARPASRGAVPAPRGELLEALAALVERERRIGSNQLVLERTAESTARLKERYLLVASDLSELISLRPEETTDGEDQLRFYTQGIMEGLPRMYRLRDGIPDLVALSRELSLAGGWVTVEGPTAHEEFMTRITAMRQAAAILRAEKEEAEARTARATSEIERLRAENSEDRAKLVSRLKAMLQAISRG